jgi:multiple sugar transport system ATP-binding protein
MGTVALRNITKRFGSQTVIDDLSLEINHGEFVTLLGPSGCGKTTLLRMIAGLETIDEGSLLVDGKGYNTVPPQKRPFAMVFQSYALFPHMRVRDNILFGLKIKKVPAEEMAQKLEQVLAMLELKGLEHRLPREISGGQKQRVALARALVLEPEVLLLDEPLSNLDSALRETAMEELKRVHRQVHKTVIYVTHNQIEAMTMSDRVAVLQNGRLEQYDTPRAVYDVPRTVFAAGFVGNPAMNFFDGSLRAREGAGEVETPIGRLQVDEPRRELVRKHDGQRVRVGIRPQSVLLASQKVSRRASDTAIGLTAELIESMGDRSVVVGRTENGTVVRFLVDREEDFKVDDRLDVFIDGRRVHLFDTQTGLNLTEQSEEP